MNKTTQRYSKPQWQILAEKLVDVAVRDMAAKRRRISREKVARTRLFNLEERVHVK
jgi:hypothetical protein